MPDQPEPIRRSQLPCTPPPENEFLTWFPRPDGGGDMAPGQHSRGVQVRRRVTWGPWEPVTPDHWAEEPPSDAGLAQPAAGPSVPADADLRDRIAQAAQDGPTWLLPRSLAGEIADAVLAILPAPADRADVLREAADDWTAHCPDHTGAEEAFMDCPCEWAYELRRKADELEAQPETPKRPPMDPVHILGIGANDAQQAETQAAADCPYGVGPGDGSGCIKPAGHDGDHVVTAGVPVMPCSPVIRQPHMPHSWRPQPGMAYVHCPGHSFDTAN